MRNSVPYCTNSLHILVRVFFRSFPILPGELPLLRTVCLLGSCPACHGVQSAIIFHFSSCMESPLPFVCPLFCLVEDLFIVKHEHVDSERANCMLMGVCTTLCKTHQLRAVMSENKLLFILSIDVSWYLLPFCAGSSICTTLPSMLTTTDSTGSTAAWLSSPRGCSSR